MSKTDFTAIKYSGQGSFKVKKGTIDKHLFFSENHRHLPIASVNDPLKRKNKHVLTLSDLSIILKQSGRHMALSRLVTLSVSSLRNLDIEANKFYDIAQQLYDAALLTRCYTQHALQSYIDSKINHIRHFIKIQFVNKGIVFINLPSIFKDNSFISSIPTYFENKESPIVCYKYNKPIRSTFSYKK